MLRAGHVLITSRIANWSAGVEPLELHVLAPDAAVAFLLERTPHRRNRPTTRRGPPRSRVSWTGWPWPWSKLGRTSTSCGFRSPSISQRWEAKRPEVLRWHDERLMQYPASVAITWETTFAQLTEPEQRLLEVLAWLAPEPIPLFLFEAAPLKEAISDPREVLAGLAAYSLARFEAKGDAVLIHRLVQEISRGHGGRNRAKAGLQTALNAVDA